MIVRGILFSSLLSAILLVVFGMAQTAGTSSGPAHASGGCAPVPAGLVGWWPGDGDANDVYNRNHGTLVGDTTFAPGKVGQAFAFDGNLDWVSVDHDPSLDLDHFTLDAWVKTDLSPAPQWQALISKSALPRPPSLWLHFDKVETWVDLPRKRAQAVSVSRLTDSEWVHLATTYDGTAVKIYINGALDVGRPNTGNTPPTNNLPYHFGGRNYPPENPDNTYIFKGLMDEIEIFDRALTPAEIQAIYDAGELGKCRTSAIIDFIQELPDSAFKKPAPNRKNALVNKLAEAQNLIDSGEYQEAIDKLNADIRAKMDGCLEGNSKNDWIIDCPPQVALGELLDQLVSHLESLQ